MKLHLNKFLTALLFAGIAASAQSQTAGGPDDGFIGCDGVGECSIRLDEFGNISGSFAGFFGPYDVTLSPIAPTVDAAYAGLEVTSYSFVGKGGLAPFRLTAGAIGLCDVAVSANGLACLDATGAEMGKGDVLIFKPGINDANGYGHSIIDFLSDGEEPFAWATQFNVLEVGPEGNNGATYQTGNTGFYPDANGTAPAFEKMTYFITSDGCLSDNPADCVRTTVPEPGSLLLVALALAGLGLSRRRTGTLTGGF